MAAVIRGKYLKGKSDQWGTPFFIKNVYKDYFDPCPRDHTVDGLSTEWPGDVYLNPPFSQFRLWIKKLCSELKKQPKRNVVVLIPIDRLDRNYIKDFLQQSDVVYFRKKIHFVPLDNQPTSHMGYHSNICLLTYPKKGKTSTFEVREGNDQ